MLVFITNQNPMESTNEKKLKLFYQHLGPRFKTFEIASENAPITFLAIDNEDKEYYVHVEIADNPTISERDKTGIKIQNTHFYHLHAMASQNQNIFWFEVFQDGYMLFYINDCLTPEQLKVTEEYTLIGVTSALHVEYDKSLPSKDGVPTYKGTFNDFSLN